MSLPVIRKLLESRLALLLPSLPTAFDNVAFTVQQAVPHQEVNLIPAGVEDPSFGIPGGVQLKREVGLMQVTLCYPEQEGSGAAEARAEAVRAHFPRGLVLQEGSVRLVLVRSPSVHQGRPSRGFFRVPVSIYYSADVYA